MKNIFLLCLVAAASIFTTAYGLRCYSCTNARSNAQCRHLVTCSWGSLGCENEIRLQNGKIFISKHCKQYAACRANLYSNFRQCAPKTLLKAARSSVKLGAIRSSSLCRSCCDKDRCNAKPFIEESVSAETNRGVHRYVSILPPTADVESTLLSESSALITFTDPSDTPGATYYITLKPNAGVELNPIKPSVDSKLPGVHFNDTIPKNVIAYIATGLSGGVVYRVSIVKKVGFQHFAQGEFDNFLTPPQPLQGMKAIKFEINSVLLDVGKPIFKVEDKYDSIRVSYRKTSDLIQDEKLFPSFTRPGIIRLSDLQPSTEYIISAWTSIDKPNGSPKITSKRVNITVFTKVPRVNEVELKNHHATNLTWEFKTSYERSQKNFVVTVRDDTDEIFVAENVIGGSRRFFTATKLIPEHYYTFTIKAETDGHYSEVVRSPPVRTVSRCYGCLDASTREECMKIIECKPDDRGCLVELRSRKVGYSRFSKKSFRATMTCKQVEACDKQEDQNLSHQCDPTARNQNSNPPEVCRCCCEGDLCDGPGTDCGRLLGWLDPLKDVPVTTQTPVEMCEELVNLRDGFITCTEGGNLLGTTCTFSCRAGTYLMGIGKTECLPGGTWSHRVPVCHAVKRCPAIESSYSSYVRCTAFNRPFSRCVATCRPGFVRVGSGVTLCRPNGLWTKAILNCVERDECVPNPCINDGKCKDRINSFKCICEPGYYGEVCERKKVCEKLFKPKNGDLQCTNNNKFGSRCRYSCDVGYSMHGLKYTRCNQKGMWSSTDLTICVVNKCDVKAQSLVNGGKMSCSGYAFGDTCTFSCPEGLKPAGGPNNITCLETSEWSSEPPCCDLPCPPYAKVDLFFVLDSSSSVGKKSWKELIRFTVALLDYFVVGKRDMRVAVLRYNNRVDTKNEIELGDYSSAQDLRQKLRSMPYNGHGTKTGKALDYFNKHSINVKGNRPGVPDVVVVITDGLSSDNVKIPSQKLRAKGCKLYVVGVINKTDRVNIAQLQSIASGPKYLQIIDDGYQKLAEKLSQRLITDVCWMPCAHKYEMKELIDRHRQLAAMKIAQEDMEFWEQFDRKISRFSRNRIDTASSTIDANLVTEVENKMHELETPVEDEVPVEKTKGREAETELEFDDMSEDRKRQRANLRKNAN